MSEKNCEWPEKATNGKKQKCATHICEPVGVSVPMRCIRWTHNTRGGTDWNGGTKVGGWNDVWRGAAGTHGHGDCELWINCHRVFDLWCLCRFVALYRLALSFFFFTFPGWRDLFPFPFFFQGDSFLFGRHPLSPALPTICLRLIDCVRSSSISATGISITVLLSFFYNNDFPPTNTSLSFTPFLPFFYLFLYLTAVLITVLTFTYLSLMFLLALAFVLLVCRPFGEKLTTWFDMADVGIIWMSATIRFGVWKIFQSAEVPSSIANAAATRGCCIINFLFSITGVFLLYGDGIWCTSLRVAIENRQN